MSSAARVPTRRPVHVLLLLAAAITTACGTPVRVALPSGAGTPFPDFVSAYTHATSECRSVKTMSASLSLSGRAGSTKLAARIDAGFAEPARLRLEGYPRVNFGGKPFFVLVANGETATLVLTRDDRVLRGAAPAAIVEALAGVALDPGELRAVVAGCALGAGQPAAGRSFANGWAAVDAADATMFLRQQDGQWRVAAARRGSLTVEYSNYVNGRPSTVHLYTNPPWGIAPADLTLRTSQVEINQPLDDTVFNLEVPRTATPLTLEELRRALGAETEATEDTGQDQRGDAEARSSEGRLSSRAALRAANRARYPRHKQPWILRPACVWGTSLDSLGRPAAGPRLDTPCLRASVLISSRVLRPLRARDLRPLRPRALRPLRQPHV